MYKNICRQISDILDGIFCACAYAIHACDICLCCGNVSEILNFAECALLCERAVNVSFACMIVISYDILAAPVHI